MWRRTSAQLADAAELVPAYASPTIAARISHASRRIAIVGPGWSSLVRLRGDFIAGLLNNYHRVLCLAPDDPTDPAGHHVRHLEELGAICARFQFRPDGLHPLADRKTVGALKAKLADWRPHAVLAYQNKAMLLAAIAARKARVPRIVLLASDLGEALGGSGQPGWRWRRLMRAGLSRSHAVIFHNRSDLQRISGLFPLPAATSATVVPGAGVDLIRYRPLPLPSVLGGLTFLMVSPLRREKGVIEFCQAARKVRSIWPQTRFVLAGPQGVGASALRPDDLAGFADCVEMRGDHHDVRPLFEDAHVVVQPSWREGMSRILLEALASGRPVIASDVPGCREAADVRVNGILVPPRDADALAAAIVNVIERPELLASMARASRLKAERLFDVREVNASLGHVLGLDYLG